MESILHDVADFVVLAIQTIAIVVAAVGSLRALVAVVRSVIASAAGGVEPRAAWFDCARWCLSYFLDREMERAGKPQPMQRSAAAPDAWVRGQ